LLLSINLVLEVEFFSTMNGHFIVLLIQLLLLLLLVLLLERGQFLQALGLLFGLLRFSFAAGLAP
jgi:hypothetical protein